MNKAKFDKINHHYIPQYWLRNIRGQSDHLWVLEKGAVTQVSTRNAMSEEYLYTVFDCEWAPSDDLEDALSEIEAQHAELINRLKCITPNVSDCDRVLLCQMLALQVCRHPDSLNRYPALVHETAELFSDVHQYTTQAFIQKLIAIGISTVEADEFEAVLRAVPELELKKQACEVCNLSPQSSLLPKQDAIRATPIVIDAIKKMDLAIVSAGHGEYFAIGDTPIPPELGNGFVVPISDSFAVVATISNASPSIVRRSAYGGEVENINQTQFENAATAIVCGSKEVLKKLHPSNR